MKIFSYQTYAETAEKLSRKALSDLTRQEKNFLYYFDVSRADYLIFKNHRNSQGAKKRYLDSDFLMQQAYILLSNERKQDKEMKKMAKGDMPVYVGQVQKGKDEAYAQVGRISLWKNANAKEKAPVFTGVISITGADGKSVVKKLFVSLWGYKPKTGQDSLAGLL